MGSPTAPAAALVLALAGLAIAGAVQARAPSGPAKVFFEDTVPSGTSSSIAIRTHRPAAFRVLLRAPTAGRARLFLTGKRAPRGGPLIDTRTYGCEGAAGSFYCRASYEPLPSGTYTWRIAWTGRRQQPAHVELTVRW